MKALRTVAAGILAAVVASVAFVAFTILKFRALVALGWTGLPAGGITIINNDPILLSLVALIGLAVGCWWRVRRERRRLATR